MSGQPVLPLYSRRELGQPMRRCRRAVRWAMASSAAPRLSITTQSTSSPKADRSAHPTRVPVVLFSGPAAASVTGLPRGCMRSEHPPTSVPACLRCHGKEDRLVDGDAGKSPARGGSHRYVSNLLTTLSNRVSIPNSSQHYRTSATAAVLTWHSVMPVRIHACRHSLEHEGDDYCPAPLAHTQVTSGPHPSGAERNPAPAARFERQLRPPLPRPRSRSTEPPAAALPAEAARSVPATSRLPINYPAD